MRVVVQNHSMICIHRHKASPLTEKSFIRRCEIDNDIWQASFKYGIVRNFDRVVSGWKDKIKNKCFKEFVEDLSRFDVNNNTFDRYTNFIVHHFSALLNSKYYMKELNFIGRFENLRTTSTQYVTKLEFQNNNFHTKTKSTNTTPNTMMMKLVKL